MLKGKVAIITGSGQGIGKGIACRFAREGAKVVICDMKEDLVKQVEKRIIEQNGIALGVMTDVTKAADIKNLVEKVLDHFGTIDILINNAGITRDVMSHRMSEEQWDLVIDINLKGSFLCCQAVLPTMRDKNYGKIVNISSAARFGNPGQVNYAASKEGIVGLTRSLAKEVGAKGINVNAVAPGFIETAMSKAVPPEILKEKVKIIPMLRQGTVEEVASTCLFLASDESSFITGQVIHVDGGRYMP